MSSSFNNNSLGFLLDVGETKNMVVKNYRRKKHAIKDQYLPSCFAFCRFRVISDHFPAILVSLCYRFTKSGYRKPRPVENYSKNNVVNFGYFTRMFVHRFFPVILSGLG